MKTLPVAAGVLVFLAAGAARAQGDHVDLVPGGSVCDKGDRSKKITRRLFEAPAPQPR